jgi:transcriptional activator SPT8
MDDEDESRSPGSMMDGASPRPAFADLRFAATAATSQISEDESDNDNEDNGLQNDNDNDNDAEMDQDNDNDEEEGEMDVDAEGDADGDQDNERSSPSTPKSPPPRSPTSPPQIRKREPPQLQDKADTCSSYDIVPVLAAPHATSVNAITATMDMRWVFTGGSDGYIRKFDHFASMNGKVPLTVAQKHPFVDSVTKVLLTHLLAYRKAGVLLSYWENEEPAGIGHRRFCSDSRRFFDSCEEFC